MRVLKCGTLYGYKVHKRLGQQPCDACREANNKYVRERQRDPEVAARRRERQEERSRARRAARIAAAPTPIERLLTFVEQTESGCWMWRGGIGKSNGYGRAWYDGDTICAHTAVWLASGHTIPDGLELDHVCHSRDLSCRGGVDCPHRRCVNPDHLEPVPPLVNQRRAVARVTHCPAGHEYTEANTRFKGNMRHCRACHRERARAARRVA